MVGGRRPCTSHGRAPRSALSWRSIISALHTRVVRIRNAVLPSVRVKKNTSIAIVGRSELVTRYALSYAQHRRISATVQNENRDRSTSFSTPVQRNIRTIQATSSVRPWYLFFNNNNFRTECGGGSGGEGTYAKENTYVKRVLAFSRHAHVTRGIVPPCTPFLYVIIQFNAPDGLYALCVQFIASTTTTRTGGKSEHRDKALATDFKTGGGFARSSGPSPVDSATIDVKLHFFNRFRVHRKRNRTKNKLNYIYRDRFLTIQPISHPHTHDFHWRTLEYTDKKSNPNGSCQNNVTEYVWCRS